eukprot:c32166_g1_i1.p1 GENE.c32166_g1_i1~~c32166_g1_i1.p1  ORF type:complete len:141 (-),score=29.71 c32166_g1_i1:61-483(-)
MGSLHCLDFGGRLILGSALAVSLQQHSSVRPFDNSQLLAMADIQAERKLKDAQVRAAINQKLIESGEKERLKDLLRTRLVECGWRDDLKAYCKEVIKNKGLNHITVEELVADITPRGRATVPDAIKAELLQKIRKFLTQS